MESPEDVIVSFDGEGLRLDTSEEAEQIVQQLADKDVTVLILQGNTFGVEAAERVGIELEKQSYLREAHFKDIFTTRSKEEVPESLTHILDGVHCSGARLKLLDLSDNAIGPVGAPSVIKFLESPSCETLEVLLLHNCGLGPEGSTSIASVIPKLVNLKTFICGRNRLENKGATNMSRALKELNMLEVLKFNQNGIHVDGIREFAQVFIANQNTLREFDLSDNTIKADGARALAKAVKFSNNLETINMSDALLENEGFEIFLLEGLSQSPSLPYTMVEVNLEGNEIHGQKMVDLVESVFSVCTPTFRLNLLANDFSPDELLRLDSFKEKFDIIVDDYDDEDYENDDDDDDEDGQGDEQEEDQENGESDVSNGFVNFGNIESELREVSQDFIATFKAIPFDKDAANAAFMELISTGGRPLNNETNFQAVQILCEELGLMKPEETRKRKPLERDAVVYIGKRIDELPPTFKNFFQVIVKNNDDLSCGKILFSNKF